MVAVTLPAQGVAPWYSYAGLLHQMARPSTTGVLRKNGSNIEGWCNDPAHGRVSQSTDQETAWQGLYDHISNHASGTGHKGGELLMNVDDFPIDTQLIMRPTTVGSADGSDTVWPVRVRGTGLLPRAAALSGIPGGTRIRWNSGSPPGGSGANQGAMIGGADAHGCEVMELTLDGNSVARRCGASGARAFRWYRVMFRKPYPEGFAGAGATAPTSNDQTIGIGCLITNGSDGSSDRYVQQRCIDCDFIGDSGGVGFVNKDFFAGSSSTDGRLFDAQMNGMNDGDVFIGEGGWGVFRGHWTMNNTSGDRKWGLWAAGGFFHMGGVYIDIVGLGPNMKFTNSSFEVEGGFMISNGKVSGNTYPIVDVGGNDGSLTFLWGGSDVASYVVAGTTGAQLIGQIKGPTGSYGSGVKQQTWSDLAVRTW